MKPLSWLLLAALLTIGCQREDLGGGLTVVNQTGARLTVVSTPIRPNGGTYTVTISDCSDSVLTARAMDGSVVAQLTDEWCPGQVWTITGEGESTLEDA